MPDYGAFTRALEHEIGAEHDYTFAEVEAIVGGRLPASARKHAAWWANTSSHSHASAWMRPGWRTSGVDLAGERVTFFRASEKPDRTARRRTPPSVPAGLALGEFPSGLSDAARHMIGGVAEARSIGWDAALAEVVNEAAAVDRRRLWAWFDSRSSGAPGTPAADLVREARDER